MTGSPNSRLEIAGHIAFLLMCVVVTGVALQRGLPATTGAAEVHSQPVKPGTQLRLSEELRRGSEGVVLLALSTSCRFCTESMTFYERLTDNDAVRSGRLSVGVLSVQGLEPMRAYLATHGLQVPAVVQLGSSGVQIQGTPTLVVVDRAGVVRESWGGLLGPQQQAKVLRTISDVARERTR